MMIKLYDFNDCEKNFRVYGGTAGRKQGIIFEGENYLLKYPGNVRKFKNVNVSYSNSPVCEYLGSHIYEILGIPVHETLLGIQGNKIVVACKDFLKEGEKLNEFGAIKVTFLPDFLDSNGNETNGAGMDLEEILKTIEEHPMLQKAESVKERFWDMFVVDALIGNPDRNNGNWGIISNNKNQFWLAPVFDNGNCLNDKWDDEKMESILNDAHLLETEGFRGRRCIFEMHSKRINPYQFIESMQNQECNIAVKRIVARLDLQKIFELIDSVPVISLVQNRFYKAILQERYEKILKPVYQKIIKKELPKKKEWMPKL